MTANRKPYAEQCTRVYTRRGRAAHLLSPVSTIRNGRALCPVDPQWPGEWLGTGTQAEHEHAASLPLCRHCERSAKAEDDYYAELSQWNKPVSRAVLP